MNAVERITHNIVLGICLFMFLSIPTLMGCAAACGTLAYIIKGTEVDPECKALKGKVVVVCRPRPGAAYQYGDAAQVLARSLNRMLSAKHNPKKVQFIHQQDVEEYCGGMEASMDFQEIGKALNADQVIAVDLMSYNHIVGTNVWQGKADVNVQLIDVPTGNVIYEPESVDTYVYPPNRFESEMNEMKFQQNYINHLANYISKFFCRHDPRDIDL